MNEYVAITRRGQKNSRVLLADGTTRLVSNRDLATRWTRRGRASAPVALQAQKFGMEFEFTLPRDKTLELERKLSNLLGSRFAGNSGRYHVTQYSKWQWGTDGSISSPMGYTGIELKTPILSMTNNEDFVQLKAVLQLISDLGGKVNKSTGTHVHLSFGSTAVPMSLGQKLFDAYGNWESNFFDRIVAPSRVNNRYCKSCRDHGYSDRYHKFNLVALSSYGTLEFRQHQGTLSYNKIVSWLGVISTWVKVMTIRSFPTPANFEHALTLLNMGPALTTWARSRYEDFNE